MRHWYKDILSDFKKQYFDSFRRTKRLNFVVVGREGMSISTTIAQLNWSREIFRCGILEWAIDPDNRKQVKLDMHDTSGVITKKRARSTSPDNPPNDQKRRKRHFPAIVRRYDIVLDFK